MKLGVRRVVQSELKQRTRQHQHTHIMTSPRLETPAPVSSSLGDSDVDEESVEVFSSEIPMDRLLSRRRFTRFHGRESRSWVVLDDIDR